MEGLPPGVCLPAIWPSKCPKSVHKTSETSVVSPKAEGHSANSLPRRLLDNGRIKTTCTSTCSNNIEHCGRAGICNKLPKVPVDTFPANRIPRVHGELSKHEFKSPKDKLKKVQNQCQKLLDNPVTTVRELSKVLGLLSSSIQAVFPAPLHHRYLQQAKNSVLKKQNSYEALISLNSEALEEVRLWRNNLVAWDGRALLHRSTDLTIETDASLQGWGAHCQGISTGGTMVQARKPIPYKLPGTSSRIPSHPVFHK